MSATVGRHPPTPLASEGGRKGRKPTRRQREALGAFAGLQQQDDGKGYLRDCVELLSRELGGESLSSEESERLGGYVAVFQQPRTKAGLEWFESKVSGGVQ